MRWSRTLGLLVLAAHALGDETGVDQLLGSPEAARREEGAARLGAQGDTTAAKRLIGMLQDRDWGVRMAAARALAPIAFEPGREALRELAVDGEIRALRLIAAEGLRDHDAKHSAERLAARLGKLKKEARLPYLEALGVIGTEEGIEALSKQMRAPDPEHRMAAARALGNLRAGEKALAGALKDREDAVEILAAIALARVDSDTAREAVLDWAEDQGDLTEGYALRRIGRNGAEANREAWTAALDARVAKSGKPGPLLVLAAEGGVSPPAAREHLDHRDPLTRAYAFRVVALGPTPPTLEEARGALTHKERAVRVAAAEAVLARQGEELEAALRALLLHKDADVAMVAVRKAVETRTKAVLPELTQVAQGKAPTKRDWQVRTAAAVGVGRVGYDRDLDALIEMAGAREWWLRAAAFEGLFHTYDKRVLPVLIDAFNDHHPVARMTARRNLRAMSGQHYAKQSMYRSWWEKVKDTIELTHPEKQLEELDKYGYDTRKFLQEILKGTDIVAIRGRWDKVELVLQDLDVTHMAVRAQEIKDFGLSPRQVVLVNCEGSVDSTTAQYLQWMVVAGGYMATTDWSLVNATTKTFPGVVKGYVRQSTGNDVVVVEPAEPANPILRGVFHENVDLKWWLEIQAFPIAIEDPLSATVLVDSLEMLTRYGSSAMMVEWPEGLGRVLHSTSHFYLQKEGFAQASTAEKRRIFAADHLGLTIGEIRDLDRKGAFEDVNNTTPISKSYSMFHLLVNFINEKRRRDLER